MKRADRAFVAYLAALAMVVAVMAANKVVVAGSSIPSRLSASGRSLELTARSVGPAQSSRVADALDLR